MKKLILICSVLLPVLMIAACAKPKAELSVSKTQIQQGESVSVNWTTQNAKDVTLNGQKVAKTGTQVVQPTVTTTYELVGRKGSKEARDTEKVIVEVAAASPSISLTADPSAIAKGQKSRLRWSSQNSDKVEIAGLGSFGPSGDAEVAPLDSTTYTAVARGRGGQASASARITVTGEPTQPPPTDRGGDLDAIRKAFDGAVRPIYFDFDKSDLRPDAVSTLQSSARFLLQPQYRSIVFRVEGNCDPRGSEEYNLALGDRRGNAAKTYLISQGVDPSRMDVISNGKRNAAGASEGTPNSAPSWAHDRRDDFVYVRGGELRPAPGDSE